MGAKTGSIAKEIISEISIKYFNKLKSQPEVIAMPDIPVPTSYGLTKNFYPSTNKIIKKIFKIFKKYINYDNKIFDRDPHDIPDKYFKGPF